MKPLDLNNLPKDPAKEAEKESQNSLSEKTYDPILEAIKRHPGLTKEEALKIVQYYLCRWEIETFFNVLKNGYKIEERELQTRDRLETMITMFMYSMCLMVM